MSDDGPSPPKSPLGDRASGVLMHVTSLPSPYGIGDIGPSASTWIDRLSEAGQTWWQVLPLGPIGRNNSPYEPVSSFAGNWLLISPEWLFEDGLLERSDVAGVSFSETSVDYEAVIAFKNRLLQTAWNNFRTNAGQELKQAFEQFGRAQAHWLDDYALFQSLKARFRTETYLDWPLEFIHRQPAVLAQARGELADQIEQIRLAQFLLSRQDERFKEHAQAKGVRVIGDLPFFVSPDSCDVWANPELFLLDECHRPLVVAGVPPDYFSEQGQLWGNPVYDWEALRRTSFRWYIDRVRALLARVDLIRLDHFRGFAAAWQIPAGAPTAHTGQWVPTPGMELLSALQRELGHLPFIAEDLGLITPDVFELRDRFHLPGMRVLQFAFDGGLDNPHLPYNYVPNSVVFTGTHDNNTTRGWYEELPDDQRQKMWRYLNKPMEPSSEVVAELLLLAWSSVATLAIAPLQDFLNLGADGRMNIPGRADGNWRWRCAEGMLSASSFDRLRDLTENSNRLPNQSVRQKASGPARS
jgi:4-alpha-glucanotransferase